MSGYRVADLLADPILDTELLSGAGGLRRPVLWAQTSEMADPERWLGAGELLMTVGLSLPPDGDAQRAFLRRLDGAGLAGMTIGDDGLAPPLTDELLEEADALGFPVMRTGPDTPFVVVTRTVAAANSERQGRALVLLSRLYQLAGQQDLSSRRSGEHLRELLGVGVTVVDEATGCIVVGDGVVAEPAAGRAHPLKTIRPTRLLLDEPEPLDSLVLVHLTQVLAVDANAVMQDALRGIEAGRAELQRGGVLPWPEGTPFHAVAAPSDAEDGIALALALAGIASQVSVLRERAVAVVRADDLDAAERIFDALGVTAGVSDAHAQSRDVQGATAEARSELDAASGHSAAPRWLRYVGGTVSLLARSQSERAAIVAEVLGPLAGADERAVQLRTTLFTYLEADLHQKRTAQLLGIHAQSLVYRLRRIEELTGRGVRTARGISELWLAREAWGA